MDFEFTEDHQSLRDAVRRFIDQTYGLEQRRAIVAKGGFDRAAYTALADLGLSGICISDAYGGMGMGAVECMVVMEELGRAIALEPLAQTWICSAVLQAFAPAAIQQTLLPAMASGEKIVVWAQQERKARYDLHTCAAKATLTGKDYVLNGVKNLVSVGDHADAFLVPAELGGKLALFLVARHENGVTTRGHACQDGSRAADVSMVNAPAHLLTLEAARALQQASDCGIAYACAYAVGAMEKTVAITAEYLNTRKQFGQTLASFQALRHRMADMKMQLELARSMSYFVSMKLGSPESERSRAASLAKVQLGQSMRYIGQQAVQLHGGIAMTDEYIVSHYFKSLTQLEISFGDTLHHLGQTSARMQESAGVFA